MDPLFAEGLEGSRRVVNPRAGQETVLAKVRSPSSSQDLIASWWGARLAQAFPRKLVRCRPTRSTPKHVLVAELDVFQVEVDAQLDGSVHETPNGFAFDTHQRLH
jgi:hypothetical protein